MTDLVVTITATEFKAKCLSLIDQVHDSGKPVLITKHGRVVASLEPKEDFDQKPWLKQQRPVFASLSCGCARSPRALLELDQRELASFSRKASR